METNFSLVMVTSIELNPIDINSKPAKLSCQKSKLSVAARLSVVIYSIYEVQN
jgi:hypothetical protein